MNAWTAPVLGLVCVGLLAGCITFEDPIPSPTSNAEVIDDWIEEATQRGVSDRQLGILTAARDAGEVTREDVDLATADYLECMDNAGLEYIYQEEEAVAGSGVMLPAPLIKDPGNVDNDPDYDEDRIPNLSDECQFFHEIYVASAYYAQLWVAQAEAAVWGSDLTRQCLTARGHTIEDDATPDEIKTLNDQDIMTNMNNPGFVPCVTNSVSKAPEGG